MAAAVGDAPPSPDNAVPSAASTRLRTNSSRCCTNNVGDVLAHTATTWATMGANSCDSVMQ